MSWRLATNESTRATAETVYRNATSLDAHGDRLVSSMVLEKTSEQILCRAVDRSTARKTAKPASGKRSAPASSRSAAGPDTKHARIIAMLRMPTGLPLKSHFRSHII